MHSHCIHDLWAAAASKPNERRMHLGGKKKNKRKTYLFRERLGGMVYIGMSECAEKQKRKEIQII